MLDIGSEEYSRYKAAKYTAQIFLALGSEIRVRLVEELADGQERTIAQLVEAIGKDLVTTGRVSSHLGELYRAGIVGWRRGNRSYYRLIQPVAVQLCELVAEWRAKSE